MQKRILCYAVACLLSLNVFSQYIYEGNQSLVDLTNESNTTNLNSGDDQLSSAFNLDFTFDFYGESFTSARMATNGCLHFGLGTGSINYNNYCGDYTPDPLPQYNYTLFPFWTDLIRDSNSKMLAKNFSDKAVFGWYDMREYNRASDNSFEVILWTNDSYEFRYGALDIIQHDVLIGEQGKEDEIYTYYYHDECNTGTTNTSSCYSYDWNNSDKNQNLENGGSLYQQNIDCSDPLNDVSCVGYWDAYDDLQCDLDPQYGPFCPGYTQDMDIGYYQEEEYFDYGYEEELFDYGYEEYDMYDTFEEPLVFEEYIFEEEYDVFEEPEFVFEEEIIFEEFQPIDNFIEPLPFIREEEVFIPIEDLMVEEFVFQETFIEEVEEWFEEETIVEEELAYAEESEEELIEELVEEEEIIEEEIEEEELVAEVSETKSSISKETALRVVSSTLSTAKASISGTTSGSSIHATGGTTGASSVASSSSGGGVSTSNSPSISEQFASSTAQNNQVLDMSTNVTTSTSVEAETVETVNVAVDTTTTQTLQSQIDVSMPTNSTANEAEQIVEDVIAQNLQAAQEDVQAQQEETGEYGSENTIIAYMGFVPNFNNYRLVTLPDKETWYEPTVIYENNRLSDNVEGFYQMAGQSLETLIEMRELQPKL